MRLFFLKIKEWKERNQTPRSWKNWSNGDFEEIISRGDIPSL